MEMERDNLTMDESGGIGWNELEYCYFKNKEGDIIATKIWTGSSRHRVDKTLLDYTINGYKKEPKKFIIKSKKRKKIRSEPCGSGWICTQSEELKGTFKEI